VLAGADLARVTFEGVEAPGCNLESAALADAQFNRCTLAASVWVGVCAPEARITRCDLSYADLSYAQLAGAVLSGCDLTDANLHGVDAEPVSLAGCTMRRTRMTDRDRLYGETWKPPD